MAHGSPVESHYKNRQAAVARLVELDLAELEIQQVHPTYSGDSRESNRKEALALRRELSKTATYKERLIDALTKCVHHIEEQMTEAESLDHMVDNHDPDSCVVCGARDALARAGYPARTRFTRG